MKKTASLLLVLALSAAITGCSTTKAPVGETTVAATAAPDKTTTAASTETTTTAAVPKSSHTTVRIGSLKGPTSMGLVQLMEQSGAGSAAGTYEFTMVVAADELLGKIISGELDIALIPANVASVLYAKTQGGISVININTLGVLDIVASDDSIQTFKDLKGKTVYLTGKGTTPDYVMSYLMSQNGLAEGDVTLEYKSEATEVAAILKEQPEAVGLLPQPFVTAACAQNEALQIRLDLTKEWGAIQGENGSQLVTGVTVVRNAFLAENKDAVNLFLTEHQASAAFTSEQPDQAAELIAKAGIIEKAPVAKKALPYCNITCITGEDMKTALSGYLQVLFEQDAKSIGGKLPADDFYFIP